MKFNKSMIFAAMLAIGSMFAGCSEGEYWDSYSEESTKYSFQTASNSFSYAPTEEIAPIKVLIVRTNSNSAESLPVELASSSDVFTASESSVSFNAGESTAEFTINVGSLTPGITYTATVSIANDLISVAGSAVYKLTVSKELVWEETGVRGYYLDGVMSTGYGVDPSIPMAIDIFKAVGVEQYRFICPFSHVATGNDGFGYSGGYPYNGAGDCDERDRWQKFSITDAGVVMEPIATGMDWGYGEFSLGTVFGNLSSNPAYPLGIYHEAADYVEFPANSLYFSMPDMGTAPAGTPSYIFMNRDAYLNYVGAN